MLMCSFPWDFYISRWLLIFNLFPPCFLREINTWPADVVYHISVEHSPAVPSHWFVFLTMNGHWERSWMIKLLLLWMHLLLNSLCIWNQPKVSWLRFPRENVSPVSMQSPPCFFPHESSLTLTFAPIFPPSERAGHKTRLRYLTPWWSHTGRTTLSSSIWPSVYLWLCMDLSAAILATENPLFQ